MISYDKTKSSNLFFMCAGSKNGSTNGGENVMVQVQ
jgi:hypothetical protein